MVILSSQNIKCSLHYNRSVILLWKSFGHHEKKGFDDDDTQKRFRNDNFGNLVLMCEFVLEYNTSDQQQIG